jgi:alkylhydroperoxidase/carboxymuconolactone decarboxylase family protein YurZ
MIPSVEDVFRRLTIGEPGFVASVARLPRGEVDPGRLDARTECLLRIGALIAIDAPPSSYRAAVDEAEHAGATTEDLLAVLLAVAGVVGSARVVSAAPRIALAAGYDVEAALEENDPPGHAVTTRT